ncbi:MAG: cyclic nucleotide-binding domain-containing protein [Proteobacteria bacterium]|nr:cyclic nucleotide-binding domain-containing protein [Pseudomonadota bacterium]MCG2738950.1 cyclic nucleotide-binding domain-containing protein [Syntrophaceae bacterium]MBU1745805.1 cyclic nucleotide-binding domain-containing protein [Pseudomonadota bacterium]MBU1966083.1 cyclic nucleotide-binding domain-containing protein [Pseudomonadota bacterium]MBU4371368.1 cyclic nucleotide-binding domain-containing protein [Pseudomonadota bacterium]
MFQIASYETFRDGQIIFKEGSNGDWIYVVEEGEVEISKNVDGQRIVFETLKETNIFGEMAYIDKAPRSATATAKGTTVVGIIDRSVFDAEFNKLSADFQKILKMVAFRLRKTTERSVDAQDEKGD